MKPKKCRKSIYKCKMTKTEKVITTITIRKDIFDRVIEIAPKIYGVQRGALSLAVEEALEYWLGLHSHQITPLNPRPSTRIIYQKMKNHIQFILGFVPIKVHREILEQAIRAVRGIRSDRAVSNWILAMCAEGLLKPLDNDNPKYAKIFELVA